MEIEATNNIGNTPKDRVKLSLLRLAECVGMDVAQRDDHPQSAKLFADLAEAFRIDVTEDDRHYWRVILNISRALDTLIDDDKVQTIAPHLRRLINAQPIEGLNKSQAEDFAAVYRSLSVPRRQQIDRSVQMTDFARLRYDARTIEEFIAVTIDEAEYFAQLVAIDAERSPIDDEARQQFNAWLLTLGRTGYLLDSISDANADYKNEVIQIRPTIKTQLALARIAMAETKVCLTSAPPVVTLTLFKAGFEKAVRGIVNVQAD